MRYSSAANDDEDELQVSATWCSVTPTVGKLHEEIAYTRKMYLKTGTEEEDWSREV
jgi:hypothetical protein